MNQPTPNPSQEGNCGGVPVVLFPSWEGLGVGWTLAFSLQPLAL
jgi:hypothetical protein